MDPFVFFRRIEMTIISIFQSQKKTPNRRLVSLPRSSCPSRGDGCGLKVSVFLFYVLLHGRLITIKRVKKIKQFGNAARGRRRPSARGYRLIRLRFFFMHLSTGTVETVSWFAPCCQPLVRLLSKVRNGVTVCWYRNR